MKILLLCNKPPWPPTDGGAVATLNMIKGLSAKKTFVSVLAMNTSKHFTNIDDIPEEFKNETDLHFVNLDTRIDLVKLLINLIFSDKPYNLERFQSDKFEMELTKMLKTDFDIVQLEGLSLYHYLPVIRKNSSAKVVIRTHNVENLIWSGMAVEEINPFFKFYFKVLSKRLKVLESEIISEFDALVPISYNDLKWFKDNQVGIPSLVSPPGIDTSSLSENSENEPGNVFFIGSLDWRPNINGLKWFIKKVWPLVLKKIPDTTFYIAGKNASKKTSKIFLGKNIFFHGEVTSSSQFIKNKSVMVVPLFSGSGIRIKTIEGMSLGKSIVTTPAGADGLEYENKRNIFIANSPLEFAEYITKLLLDKELRRKTSYSAIENVRKNYNILASTENLLKFYRELTS